MFAAVDLGSNSFRLHIGHYDGNTIRIIKSARDPIRLGAGLDADGAQILFCNSGLESSIGWLSLGGILGNENVRLYDGSLAEWSADAALPMELAVPLE